MTLHHRNQNLRRAGQRCHRQRLGVPRPRPRPRRGGLGPGARRRSRLRKRVANAWGALEKQGLAPGASQDRLRFVATIEECVRDADFIQESAPERLDLKLDLHSKISAAAKPDALIGSSTSGLLPSEFYESATHPERCVVGHPFNPVYLLPLVEVVGGKTPRPKLCKRR